jgi:hypothetical protein
MSNFQKSNKIDAQKAISRQKVWSIQLKALPLHTLEPAKPLNDAQMCGSFYFDN